MSGDPLLVLDGVTRRFGGLTAVDNVTLSIREGERHAVIGPNGAGKTTLFNVISGELPASDGRIAFAGEDITSLPPNRRAARGIARTFQITRVFPSLSVRENVLLACDAPGGRGSSLLRPLAICTDLARQAERVMREFGLTDLRDELARHLSYGDQRRLEVALAMAGHPRLLLLDEPMAGLAAGERASLQSTIAALDRSVTVLLIEHDMDVAFTLSDRITVLAQGAVLTQGNRDEISANVAVQASYLGTRC